MELDDKVVFMRRKSCLASFAIFLLLVVACFLYLFINGLIAREKVYYIPEVGMYIKTIAVPKEDVGYILFGNSGNIALSDNTDFITVGKNISTQILLDSHKKNIYLPYYFLNGKIKSSIREKKQIVYTISEVAITDTCFFNEITSDYHTVKETYIGVSISDKFNVVKVKSVGDSIYTVLNPLVHQ